MADASSVGLLSYDPGGGHTDQLRDLSLALAIAELTNRRVVWPACFPYGPRPPTSKRSLEASHATQGTSGTERREHRPT